MNEVLISANAVDNCPPRSNPFSTRFIRPGALPYLFVDGVTAASLVERLAGFAWRGQIVGPHGSGKSTLLASLWDALNGAGQKPCNFTLHDGQRWMVRGWQGTVKKENAKLVVVDGYEQLSRIERYRLRAACRWHSWGLLVTSHAAVGLPTLFETSTSPEMTARVVARLLVDTGEALDADSIASCYESANGDVRETLFALYDVIESRR